MLSFPIFIGMENEQKFFVYVDYREDDGKPFYVGKGSDKRVKDLDRNQLHTRIKNKHGMVRKIVLETQSEQESLEKEIQLIQELKTHIDFGEGGANFTLGGEGISGYKQSDKQREVHSVTMKKKWEDPEFREKIEKNWEDPERRKTMCESIRKAWEKPENKSQMKETSKKNWENPEYRKKISESVKKKWEDPEYKKKINEKLRDPEVRKKMSIKAKERWENSRLQKIQQENSSQVTNR